jgi:hypothetical protein
MKRKILCISRHTPKAMWPSFMLWLQIKIILGML